VLPLLADKADVVLPPTLLSRPELSIELGPVGSGRSILAHLLAHIYADRSADLWKDPRNSSLLSNFSLDKAEFASPPTYDSRTHDAVFRHVCQFESRRSWQAFIPPRTRGRVGFMWDPLPPSEPGSTAYDEHFFESVSHHVDANPAINEETALAQLRVSGRDCAA
jgi:hypothetical protein